jgi:hypothetical protein
MNGVKNVEVDNLINAWSISPDNANCQTSFVDFTCGHHDDGNDDDTTEIFPC